MKNLLGLLEHCFAIKCSMQTKDDLSVACIKVVDLSRATMARVPGEKR